MTQFTGNVPDGTGFIPTRGSTDPKATTSAREALAPTGASRLARIFAFPNPVNEYAARCTAGIVVLLALAALISGAGWLLAAIAVGFVLRLLFGPRLSPAALLSVAFLAPRVGAPKMVPGPPKRFAQGIGAVLSTAAALFFTGLPAAAWLLDAALIVAASLEAFAGICLGCLIFGALQRRGVIPADVCKACNSVSLRNR